MSRAATAPIQAQPGFSMRLNPPSLSIFLVALVFAILAIATKAGLFGLQHLVPHQDFWFAIIAYLILMIGNLVRGI